MDNEVEALLKEFDLETILDICDITTFEVLKILVDGGHIELPEWTPKF